MAPGEHAATKLHRERVVEYQEVEHRAPKALGEQRLRYCRQRDKAPIG